MPPEDHRQRPLFRAFLGEKIQRPWEEKILFMMGK
jgi:hypothetical protein